MKTGIGIGVGNMLMCTASGAVEFSPDSIAGLIAWYDPAADYVTKDGSDLVSAWASRAGTGGAAWDLNVGGVAANRVWSATSGRNGGPGITFNGAAGGFIKTGAAAVSQPYTIIHSLKCTNVAAGPYASDGAVVNDSRIMYIQPADGKLQVYAGTGVISPTAIADNVWSTIVGVFNGASSISRVDGSASTAGNCGATNSSGICLGAQAGGGAGFFPGTYGHTFVFGAAVSAGDLVNLETWLSAN